MYTVSSDPHREYFAKQSSEKIIKKLTFFDL